MSLMYDHSRGIEGVGWGGVVNKIESETKSVME